MNLIKLTATNFLSFKQLDYDFESHPVLVQGENLTDDAQESNGSGKSSLQSMVEYALFKSTAKERDIDLIFWGEESATVSLSVHCPVRNQTMTVTRKIKLKGSTELTIEGIDAKFATVPDGDKLILKWIDISKLDLQNYFIINKERYKSFFSSSNREKIEMINRFSNANLIDGIDKDVQTDVDKLENELKLLESAKTSSISKIRTLKEQIELEKNPERLRTSIHDEEERLGYIIEKLLSKIEVLEDDIDSKNILIGAVNESIPINKQSVLELEKQIDEKSLKLQEVEKSLVKLNAFSQADQYVILDEKLSKINSEMSKNKSEKKNVTLSKLEIEDLLNEINRNISGSVQCPKCKHEFLVGDPDIDILEEKEAKISTEQLLAQTEKTVQTILFQLELFEDESIEINDQKNILKKEDDKIFEEKTKIRRSISAISDEIKSLNSQITSIETSISNSDLKIERYEKEKENIKLSIEDQKDQIKITKLQILDAKNKQIDEQRILGLRTQMKGEGSKLRDLNHSVKFKRDQVFNTSQWIVNFKRFNMYLANNSLKIIQGYCNKFLQQVKTDIQVRWEGQKLLANNTFKEEIAAYCIRDSEVRSFKTFSGGERVTMDFAMILTLQRMINSTHKYGGLDFLSLDEIGEGIDARGLQNFMKALSTLDKTILITTHAVNRSIGDKILLVRKENGVSTIVNN